MKNVILTTRKAAEAHILQVVALHCSAPLKPRAFKYRRRRWWDAWIRTDQESILSFNAELLQDRVNIDYLSIAPQYRGHGFGSLGVKAAVAFAHEFGRDKVGVTNVQNDGPGFWPSIGATPIKPVVHLAQSIDVILRTRKPPTPPITKVKAEAIRDVAKINWLKGWRQLAQLEDTVPIDTSEGKTRLSTLIFELVCTGTYLQIDLCDPYTHWLLASKVGAIPDFNVPRRPQSLIQRVIKELIR